MKLPPEPVDRAVCTEIQLRKVTKQLFGGTVIRVSCFDLVHEDCTDPRCDVLLHPLVIDVNPKRRSALPSAADAFE
jgi:hypothetical protein